MPESDASIAEVIRRFGLLPDEDLQSAQDAADRDGRALADSLVHGELITPDQLTWVRSQVYGLPFVHVDPTAIDVELVREFPPALLRRSKAIPLLKLDSEISFAVADPGDEEMIKDLQFACGGPVSLNLGGEENIRLALDAILEDGDDAGEDDEDEAPIKLEFDPTAFSADDDSGVAAVFFNLMSAVQNGATEVLFRAEAEGLGIHHRIGGILARKETLEGEAASAILPKIKSLAGLTEPAEGEVTSRRLTLNLFGQNYELNFLMIPVGVQHDVAVHLRRASALEAPSDDEAVAEPPVEFVDAFAELMRERSGLVVFAADDFETAFDLMTAAWAEEDGEREIVAVTSERTEAPVPVHRHHPPQGHAHVDTVLDALTPDVAILDQINHPDLAVPLNWIGPGRMVVVITPIDEALRNIAAIVEAIGDPVEAAPLVTGAATLMVITPDDAARALSELEIDWLHRRGVAREMLEGAEAPSLEAPVAIGEVVHLDATLRDRLREGVDSLAAALEESGHASLLEQILAGVSDGALPAAALLRI